MTIRSAYLKTTSMSCSTMTALRPLDLTTDSIRSMICAFSRVPTPLVGSSRRINLGRSAYATATSSNLRSPCDSWPAGTSRLGVRPNSSSTPSAWSLAPRSSSTSDAARPTFPSREKIASRTLSSVVSRSNRLTIWKLRAIPALIRPYTGREVTSCPWKRIVPASGCRRPVIRLTRVVFPAPFDPTRATSCFSSMEMPTS